MRDLLTGLAALLAIALLALMVGPHFVDWDSQRARVGTLIAERTGIPATIAGALAVRFLPTPSLEADMVTLGPAEAPLARIGHVRLALSPGALLSGKLAFAEARLDEPVLFLPALQAYLAGPKVRPGRVNLGFDRLELVRLQVLDGPGGMPALPGGPYGATVEAPSLAGPFRIQAQDAAAGRDLRVQIGQLDQGRARLRATLEDRAFGGRLALDGWFGVPGPQGRPVFDGAATFNGNPLLASPEWQIPFQGSARLIIQRDQVIADPVNLSLGGGDAPLALAGQAFVDLFARRPNLRGRLEAKRFDATPFLAPGADGKVPLRPDLSRLGLPAGLDGEIELALGALQLPGGLVQNLQLRLGLAPEGAVLELGRAELPGGTGLIFARGNDAASTPIDGTLTIESQDLQGLAAWLRGGEGLAALPQRASLSARLRGDFAGIGLEAIRIDSPAGQLAGAGRFSPSSTLSGALPRLALDLRAARFDGRVLAALDPLRPIPGIDLSTRLAIANLVVDGRSLGGLDVDLERAQENGTLRRLRLIGPGGESILLSGTSAGDNLTLTAKLDAARLGALSQIGAALLPGALTDMILTRAGQLEPALAVANLRLQRGNGQAQWDIAFDGKFAGTEVAGRSQSVQRGDQWQVSAEGRLANPDGGQLAGQISGVPLPAGGGDGLVEIRAAGNLRDLVAGQVEARLGQTRFRFDGGLNPFRSQPLEGRMTLTAQDVGQLGAALGVAGPSLGDGLPGRLTAALKATRENVTLAGVEAALGEMTARGELGLDLTRGGRLAGQIRLGEIALERLLAPAFGRNWPDLRTTWPGQGFAPPVRPPLSGDLWIEAERLRLPDGTVLEAPQFVYRFAAGQVALEGFEARAGEARLAGMVSLERKGDVVEGTGRLDLARWPLTRPGGRLSGSMPFTAAGANWQGLVASLAGAGRLAFDDLVIAGLDPGALARVAATPIDAIDPVTEMTVGSLMERNLLAGSWRVPGRDHPAGLSQGQIRVALSPESAGEAGVTIAPTLLFDLLRREVEARFLVRQAGLPQGWRGAAPEIGLTLTSRLDPRRGEMTPLQRRLDVAALLNGFLALAIQRDLERAEAFEADLRERSFHLRRQRADQFQARRQREIEEVEAIIRRDMLLMRQREAEGGPDLPGQPVPAAPPPG